MSTYLSLSPLYFSLHSCLLGNISSNCDFFSCLGWLVFVLPRVFSGAYPFCAFFIIQRISVYLRRSNPFVFSDLSIPPF